MANFIKGVIVTAVLLAFAWLCWLAWPYHMTPQTEFVIKKMAEYKPIDTGTTYRSAAATCDDDWVCEQFQQWNLKHPKKGKNK